MVPLLHVCCRQFKREFCFNGRNPTMQQTLPISHGISYIFYLWQVDRFLNIIIAICARSQWQPNQISDEVLFLSQLSSSIDSEMSANTHSYCTKVTEMTETSFWWHLVSVLRYAWSVGSVLSSVKTDYGPSHPMKKSSTRKHSNSDLALELQGLHGPFDCGSVCC